jgi:hypothetical protein
MGVSSNKLPGFFLVKKVSHRKLHDSSNPLSVIRQVLFKENPFFLTAGGGSMFLSHCSGSQETEFRSPNGNNGDVDELRRLLEEVSKLPAAYSRAIMNPVCLSSHVSYFLPFFSC